jgi:phosphoribosylanthranilate isomerase
LEEAEVIQKKSNINIFQLHSLSSDDINRLKESESIQMQLKIIRAVGIPERITARKKVEIEDFANVCDFLLFDYEDYGKIGGTGKQIPIKLIIEAAELAKNANDNIKLFLAGGLDLKRIQTEGKQIERIFDFIDVNSGVEDSPGLKNDNKIREIIELIRD